MGNKKTETGSSSTLPIPGFFTNGLAIILIIGSVGIILSLVYIHLITVQQNRDAYNQMAARLSTNSQSNRDLIESFQNYSKEVNSSNTGLLSILLPVIGAWVGAILAFYYGNKNFEKISELKATTLSPEEEKLANMRVEELLDKYPENKKVIQAKMSDKVGDIYRITGEVTNIVLVNDKGEPYGVLYKTDLTRNTDHADKNFMEGGKDASELFKDFFDHNEIKDFILQQKWTKEGLEIKNYAQINKNDTLLEARAKMEGLSKSAAVRGLVLEGNNQIIGIITFQVLGKVLTDE